jgi:hypothetical protein
MCNVVLEWMWLDTRMTRLPSNLTIEVGSRPLKHMRTGWAWVNKCEQENSTLMDLCECWARLVKGGALFMELKAGGRVEWNCAYGGAQHLHSIHTAWNTQHWLWPFLCVAPIMPHHAHPFYSDPFLSGSFNWTILKPQACQKVKADTTSVAECCPSLGFVGRSAKARADPGKELGVQHDFLQNAATSTVALWYVDTSKITWICMNDIHLRYPTVEREARWGCCSDTLGTAHAPLSAQQACDCCCLRIVLPRPSSVSSGT